MRSKAGAEVVELSADAGAAGREDAPSDETDPSGGSECSTCAAFSLGTTMPNLDSYLPPASVVAKLALAPMASAETIANKTTERLFDFGIRNLINVIPFRLS
ncbi:MAG: hypothetical protein ABSC51_04800 [Gaiellaceae bacterium]